MKTIYTLLLMLLFAAFTGLATDSLFGFLAALCLAGILCCMMIDLYDLIGKIK